MVRRKERAKGNDVTEAKRAAFPKGGTGQNFQMQQRLSKMRTDTVSYTGNITPSAQTQWKRDRDVMVQRCPEITWG